MSEIAKLIIFNKAMLKVRKSYADGRCEALPAIQEFRLASDDPEEDARLEAEYLGENQRVTRLLEAKGFGLEGDEPGGVLINRVLHTDEPSGGRGGVDK